jgi:hypothetical protein
MSVAESFGVPSGEARSIAAEVAMAIKPWRSLARDRAIPAQEIDLMASAFQEDELARVLSSKATTGAKPTRRSRSKRSSKEASSAQGIAERGKAAAERS